MRARFITMTVGFVVSKVMNNPYGGQVIMVSPVPIPGFLRMFAQAGLAANDKNDYNISIRPYSFIVGQSVKFLIGRFLSVKLPHGGPPKLEKIGKMFGYSSSDVREMEKTFGNLFG